MWIRIENKRLKDSLIREYSGRGFATSTKQWCIDMNYNGANRSFRFDSEKDYKNTLDNLDKILQVKEL